MNIYKNIDDLIKDLENFLEDNEYRLTYNGVPNDKVAAISENNCWLIINTITNLQQRCEYLERSNNRREDTILELRQEIYEQEDYKSRCEKAIKYNYELQERYCHSAIRDELIASKIYEITERELNILQNGSDKE